MDRVNISYLKSFQSWRWALLFLVGVTAVFLRFYQLGQLPPGLYRDEAFNGLDALGVLSGEHALYFPGNNGREPLYIYLVALSISLFGHSALAVRLPAAVVGSLTTLVAYKLAKTWFGARVGVLTAVLWAITLWPVHLSRVGFRAGLLPLFLALIFWLGTLAYRQQKGWLWLLTGLLYGLSFYTYLAVRVTPLLLLLIVLYLFLTQRCSGAGEQGSKWHALRSSLFTLHPSSLIPHPSSLILFLFGTAVSLLPLLLFFQQNPAFIVGRTGQVSIFNESVNGGSVVGALWQHSWQALGMFFWRGDTILRHNPAGRPIFDIFMALPFLIGVIWCLRHWRRPPAMTLLLWTAVMLTPTILAADTPHFLRAVGVLPAVVIFPALGLNWLIGRLEIGDWRLFANPNLRSLISNLLIFTLLAATLYLTLRDYAVYGRSPDTAYLFEAAAAELAGQINEETAPSPGLGAGTVIFVDNRFWSGWQAIPFLVDEARVTRFNDADGFEGVVGRETAVYAWPHDVLDYLAAALPPPALISAQWGSLARGDLQESAYPLYVRYHSQPAPDWPIEVNFANQFYLRRANVVQLSDLLLQVNLYWEGETAVYPAITTFIHIIGPDGVVAQSDAPPGNHLWHWWQPGLVIHDQHHLDLPAPLTADQQIIVGLYHSQTGERLLTEEGYDFWRLEIGD